MDIRKILKYKKLYVPAFHTGLIPLNPFGVLFCQPLMGLNGIIPTCNVGIESVFFYKMDIEKKLKYKKLTKTLLARGFSCINVCKTLLARGFSCINVCKMLLAQGFSCINVCKMLLAQGFSCIYVEILKLKN